MKTKEEKIKTIIDKKFNTYSHVSISENHTNNDFFDSDNNLYDRSDFWELVSFPDEVYDDTLLNSNEAYQSELEGITDEDEIKEKKDEIRNKYIDEARKEVEESLTYWTVYFKCYQEDIDIAIKCGLIPFTFDDEFYLALGGCGMDLSPRLNAYQALTNNSIPSSSQLLTDENYFSHVVGTEITEEVKNAIKRKKSLVEIRFEA